MLEDIDRAIDLADRALAVHPDPALALIILKKGLSRCAHCTESVKDLDHAIKIMEEALDSLAPDDDNHGTIFQGFPKLLVLRARRIGSLEDLHCAVQMGKQALDIAIGQCE